ncbi:MAG TPA: DUF1707 domain-containing protein [Micromonosporaceae bacterium]|jgi:hypothetical protein|nr:DUF1707 domain-containing protein [Micromonosporaceae bacterium]
MAGPLVPRDPEIRLSDVERERAVEHLRDAVGDGRLTLDEFEHRIPAIYQIRTRTELVRLMQDVVPGYGRELVELRTKAASLKRSGRWDVPRRLVVEVGAGSVKLDLTDAMIVHLELDLSLSIRSGQVTVVVPEGTTANVDGVTIRSGAVKSQVPALPAGPGHLHIVATGSVRSGMLRIRHQRRFWRWRW